MTPTSPSPDPSIVSVVGYKNSGKTTFVVALVLALRAQGLRVATVKHGHHSFEIDHPGTDSHRHKHEGGAEAVLLLSDRKLALVADLPEPPDPEEAIRRHLAGIPVDLVIVEGLKQGPFPKVEVYRQEAAPEPVYAAADDPSAWLAVVSDVALPDSPAPVILAKSDDSHVVQVAETLVTRFLRGR